MYILHGLADDYITISKAGIDRSSWNIYHKCFFLSLELYSEEFKTFRKDPTIRKTSDTFMTLLKIIDKGI